MTLFIIVAALLATPLAALAHVKKAGGFTWENDGKCAHQTAEISHGGDKLRNGGFAKATIRMRKRLNAYPSQIDCFVHWERPAGFLTARNMLFIWVPAKEKWQVCVAGSWNQNNNPDFVHNKSSDYARPCNSGYYGSFGGAFHWFNGAWKGEWIWSGKMKLAQSINH